MNASLLRAVLALALLASIGVVVNVLGDGALRFTGQNANRPARSAPPAATPQLVQEKERVRLKEAVERELAGRGYLHRAAVDLPAGAARAAILAFEFDHNLPLTAEASEQLLKALIFTHARAPGAQQTAPKTPQAATVIEEVQRALAHLGYSKGGVSAELDRATREAIGKFERARGLEASGRISAPLIESLGPAFDAVRAGVGTTIKARIAG